MPVIAVTGSAAKTTTVKLLAHLLGGAPRVGVSMYANTAQDVLSEFCACGSATDAVVLEASEFPVGTLQQIASQLAPTAAVVTVAGLDHYTVFRGAAGAAREMATLLRALPGNGFAVLNADDAALVSCATDLPCRVITFGTQEHADYRAVEYGVGPAHGLSVVCEHLGARHDLSTPFLGTHFSVATLAAVAAAHELGVDWSVIRERLATFEPVFGRCSLVAIPGGPLFICDTVKSPAWSVSFACDTLKQFDTAPRRTLVLGTLADYPGSSRGAYRKAWRAARPHVDRTIFLRHSPSHVGAREEDLASGEAVFLDSVQAITAFLQQWSVPGEAILLKGSYKCDHLDRVAHHFMEPVTCWQEKCGRGMNCINCEWMRDHTPPLLRPLTKARRKLFGPKRIYG